MVLERDSQKPKGATETTAMLFQLRLRLAGLSSCPEKRPHKTIVSAATGTQIGRMSKMFRTNLRPSHHGALGQKMKKKGIAGRGASEASNADVASRNTGAWQRPVRSRPAGG
jgi:hypothetical protein